MSCRGYDCWNYCVANGGVTLDKGTCDPYCKTNLDACMAGACRQANGGTAALGPSGWDTYKCKDYCNSLGKTSCLNECNLNFRPELCKNLCLENPGKCDQGAKTYCSNPNTDPNDPFCSCIKSVLVNYKYNPLCVDNNCIINGYQTAGMISALGSGCQIVDCSTQLDISKTGGNVSLNGTNIQQNCGNTYSGTSSTPDSSTNTPDSSSSFFSNNLGIIIIIVIILIVIIIAGIFLF